MGVDYSSGVMFGAFVKGGGARLAVAAIYDEKSDGDPVLIAGAEPAALHRHGNSWSGEHWYSIEIGPAIEMCSRGGGHAGPFAVPAADEEAIRKAIDVLGLKPDEHTKIGHYVYMDVW